MNRAKTFVLFVAFAGTLLPCSSCSPTNRFLGYQNAGDAASLKGDYLEAERNYQAALAVAEEKDQENPLVKIALHYLGSNYIAQGKYAEAEAAYKRQIDVAEKVHGAESPEMFTPLSDITLLYIKQRRFDEAEKYNQRALAISGKIPQGEHKEAVELTKALRDWIKKE